MLHIGTMVPEIVLENFPGHDPEMELIAPCALGAFVWTRGVG